MASADVSASPVPEADGGSSGEFVLKKLFAEFVVVAERKLRHVCSQPLVLTASLSVARDSMPPALTLGTGVWYLCCSRCDGPASWLVGRGRQLLTLSSLSQEYPLAKGLQKGEDAQFDQVAMILVAMTLVVMALVAMTLVAMTLAVSLTAATGCPQ